jgi:hypothetical protein
MRRVFSTVYQFQIELQEIKPTIWRRVQIASTSNFRDLHFAIADSFGWLDYHLHDFYIDDPYIGEEKLITDLRSEPAEDKLLHYDEVKEKVARYFYEPGITARYDYDFGDDWHHTVIFEEELPRQGEGMYPRCIDGRCHCPPEDVGGVSGYAEFLRAMANPRHKEHKSWKAWWGGPFDPEEFDPAKVRFRDPVHPKRFIEDYW